MRVHDDLAAGKSRFQAEVARLAESLTYAKGPGPALFWSSMKFSAVRIQLSATPAPKRLSARAWARPASC